MKQYYFCIKKIGVGIHYRSIPEHSVYKKKYKWRVDDYPNAKKKLEEKQLVYLCLPRCQKEKLQRL